EFANKDLKSVGNYTLGRLIGKGSFGKVYLATHKLTNGSKVVLKSANKDDSNLAREIHHHRQFVHPHIARLYEVIVTETLVWLVLEYCPGDELYNYLLQHGKLPVDKVQKTFTQLAGAVCYVHQQSCVHRDLKLENILLDKNENVKLCDFGFTREYEGKANYLQTFCGTICYSAPEMLKGEKYAGEKVDVWSLGVILYALLCGELPFDDDDDSITRSKILSQEPDYPDHLPPDALALLKSLLSKRPLLRPTLPDILAHPFLAEHAPQQLDILKVVAPAPFSTPLEQETLHRMRSAGVDIDAVVGSVLAQRCDALAGWWTLLIEKEERKARRRERKRREREAENRSSRRFSQASARLNALATVEESFVRPADAPLPRTRGRSEKRSGYFPPLAIPDMPDLVDFSNMANGNRSPDGEAAPPPIDKDSIRSASSSRHRRPIPPPKEGVMRSARSRGSTLHLVTTSDALDANSTSQAGDAKKARKRPSHAIVATWKNWTHWLFESTRRHKGASKRGSQSTPNLGGKPASGKDGKSQDGSPRPQTSKYPASGHSASSAAQTASLPKGVVANGYAARGGGGGGGSGGTLSVAVGPASSSSYPVTPGLTTPPIAGCYGPRVHSAGSHKRHSLSPSPLTPRSGAVRRASGGPMAGLRGRKSTSSSVSSVRSLHHASHHQHSHSKASSTSSNGSVSTSVSKTTPMLQQQQQQQQQQTAARSPHHSVKVLPATPTTGACSFPSNIRLVRDRAGPPLSIFNLTTDGLPPPPPQNVLPGSPNPFFGHGHGHGGGGGGGGGVMFAKRKRSVFKGPMLSLASSAGGNGGGNGPAGKREGSHSRSASAREGDREWGPDGKGTGNGSGNGAREDEVEEVEAFSPIVKGPGEIVEEKIYEEGEEEGVAAGLQPAATIKPAA
ncbi:kinase-like protein, partial [Trichocladium antarcticum]